MPVWSAGQATRTVISARTNAGRAEHLAGPDEWFCRPAPSFPLAALDGMARRTFRPPDKPRTMGSRQYQAITAAPGSM
jgi:hypothetical protein